MFDSGTADMNCILIFDHLNDIVFSKYNEKFAQHLHQLASLNGLQAQVTDGTPLDRNVIVQMFSPIITSHRIMNCQFGNSYASIQCDDNLRIYFDEYMGYLFLAIGAESPSHMKKFLNISVTIVRYLCGPDVYQLKDKEEKSILANQLIDSWVCLNDENQAVYVEAVEQLLISSDLSSAVIEALKEAVDRLSKQIDSNRLHGLITVRNKFLALYSSPTVKELSPADIVFSTLVCHSVRNNANDKIPEISSYQILLAGPGRTPKCLPHVVHIIPISEDVNIVFLLEIGNPLVAASLYETFCHLHTMQQVQIQCEKETLQPAFENLDLSIRRLNDSLKKNKNNAIENSHKQLMKKWDVIKKKYQEYLKNASDEVLLRAETLALGFLENLKELLTLTSVDDSIFGLSTKHALATAKGIKDKLITYDELFQSKKFNNFSFASYLEEFPGLVHFLYIDRSNHRVTTPSFDQSIEEGVFLKKKIWYMVNFAKNHLQEGTTSIMWKDSTFNYAYFLWFENNNGSPLKPSIVPMNIPHNSGILSEDFYQKLKEIYFPKLSPGKIKCYELFCIHLGLVTASCVLEQTRRLSATIGELKGHLSHAIDLL